MKKWTIGILALLLLGALLIALDYIIIEFLGGFIRKDFLQDEEIKMLYNLIIESNVDISKLSFALTSFKKPTVGRFIFFVLFGATVIFIYQGIVKLLKKIIR